MFNKMFSLLLNGKKIVAVLSTFLSYVYASIIVQEKINKLNLSGKKRVL